jgi:predicted transcriptional regulator
MEVYVTLLRNPNLCAGEIADKIKRDKSAVNKALQNLLKRGLVVREFRILKNGGYKYVYKPKPFENLKEMILESVERLVKDISKTLKEIEEMSNADYVKALGGEL